MGSFSVRHGHEPKREPQVDTMDDDLRRRVTDVIYEDFSLLPMRQVWIGWVKLPVAGLEREWYQIQGVIMKKCETARYNEMYDLVEVILAHMNEEYKPKFTSDMNAVLAENMSAWRIEGDTVVRILGDSEAAAVREAASISEENAGYTRDAMKAMGVTNPDYRASIAHSANIAENTLNRIGAKGSGVGTKLDSVAGRLGLTDEVVASFKQMNDFANRHARHPKKSDYGVNRDDAMLALVHFSAMSNYLYSRWKARDGQP